MRLTTLIGRYGEGEIELEGDAESLRWLSTNLYDCVEFQELSLHVPDLSPAPYLGFLVRVRLECSSGPVIVSRSGDLASISGSMESLSILAQSVERLVNKPEPRSSRPRDHIHIEYFAGNEYVSENSVPLLVAMRLA